MEPESFHIRYNDYYNDYIDEIITDCVVYRADAGLLADSAKILHRPCKALWDTGATTTMITITKNVVDALNLKPVLMLQYIMQAVILQSPVIIPIFICLMMC